jgi:hypothetical protein
MSTMGRIRTRTVATAVLLAAITVAGCAGRQSDQPTSRPSGQGVVTPPVVEPTSDAPTSPPVVLADGRHPVRLKGIDPAKGSITFDVVQWYFGKDAAREAARDHQESPPPNDYYIRNVNPKLRTLATADDATITVNNLLNSNQSVPVSLPKLASLTRERSPMFWITVRHNQVLRISEQWVP